MSQIIACVMSKQAFLSQYETWKFTTENNDKQLSEGIEQEFHRHTHHTVIKRQWGSDVQK